MRLAIAASEAAPFIKTGGLGDVLQALPLALSELHGNQVYLFLPYYGAIKYSGKWEMELLCSFDLPLAWRREYVGVFRLKSRRKRLRQKSRQRQRNRKRTCLQPRLPRRTIPPRSGRRKRRRSLCTRTAVRHLPGTIRFWEGSGDFSEGKLMIDPGDRRRKLRRSLSFCCALRLEKKAFPCYDAKVFLLGRMRPGGDFRRVLRPEESGPVPAAADGH